MLISFLQGMGMGASLIIAIGAQNAFVLVQAIRGNRPMLVAGICAFVDVVLISAGVLGIGTIVASSPVMRLAAGIGGCIFLFVFGLKSFLSARNTNSLTTGTDAQEQGQQAKDTAMTLKRTVLATLAVSLLNPHVYLDTVIMLGAISAKFPGNGRYAFGAGALCASVTWFFVLAWCGRLLAPVFARPKAWKVLAVIVGITVWLIAFGLGLDVWQQLSSW